MKKRISTICGLAIPIGIAVAVIILFQTVLMLGYVPTESMEPTLDTGSMILGIRKFGELQKGDIVVFKFDGSYLVKRIAAVEGDVIEHKGSSKTVPESCIYVLGDNAEHSYDSRYWEDPFIPIKDIMAKVILPAS